MIFNYSVFGFGGGFQRPHAELLSRAPSLDSAQEQILSGASKLESPRRDSGDIFFLVFSVLLF